MITYFRNLWLWASGFTRFKQIQFKAGWAAGDPLWWLVYAIDYGVNVIVFAGPVEPVSRYIWDHLGNTDWPHWAIDHGEHSGRALWGSVSSPGWLRFLMPALFFGTPLVLAALWLLQGKG